MAKNYLTKRLSKSSPSEELDAYNAFVETSPQGILYCKTWWLEATAPGCWEVLVLESGDAIRAAWPLVYRKGRREITMPPLTQKLGVLFAPHQATKYAEQLSEEHRLCETLYDNLPSGYRVSQKFHENFTSWLPFYWKGWQQTTRYTYVFPELSDLDVLWQGLRKSCRGHINNAIKNQIVVSDTNDIELFYDINQRTFSRQNTRFPYSLDFVQRIDNACNKHAGRKVTLAKDAQGNIHACDYLIYDEHCAISIIQGASPEYRKSGAQSLLDWRSIEFAATVSKKFDFEGSMMPGVEPYNRGFGARQMPYFVISGKRKDPKDRSFRTKCRRFAARGLRYLARAIES